MPYLGIALAVALGIATAPYVWWVLSAAVLGSVIFLAARKRLLIPALLVALFGTWATWLARQGQTADSVFVILLLGLLFTWPWISRAWQRFTGQDVDPPA